VALVNRQGNKNNFNFCICFLWNLCYGVYIPVDEVAALVALLAGSKLRHWPPGTNSKTVRAAFFFVRTLFGLPVAPPPNMPLISDFSRFRSNMNP
jgi:hypothetical protein